MKTNTEFKSKWFNQDQALFSNLMYSYVHFKGCREFLYQSHWLKLHPSCVPGEAAEGWRKSQLCSFGGSRGEDGYCCAMREEDDDYIPLFFWPCYFVAWRHALCLVYLQWGQIISFLISSFVVAVGLDGFTASVKDESLNQPSNLYIPLF